METIKNIGLGSFVIALFTFILSLTFSQHVLTPELIGERVNSYRQEVLLEQAAPMLGKTYTSNLAFIQDLQPVLEATRQAIEKKAGIDPENGVWNAVYLPEGASEWEYRMGDGDIKGYLFSLT
ncbi:MAG: hypothetical protein AAF146_19500 [Bacteroidota bacterium]